MSEFDTSADDRPPLLKELGEHQRLVEELQEELRTRAWEGGPAVATSTVREYVRAVDAYVSAGSASAVSAWRALKNAREKLVAQVTAAEETHG